MHNDQDTEESPRKGRSNAILTYETVAGIDKKLSELAVKVDGVKESIEDRERGHADHEARIRSLELVQAGMVAASTKTTGVWQWVWAAIVSTALVTLGILNYLK